MEEFNLRLQNGRMKTFGEKKYITPLTMEEEQELHYTIIRDNIENVYKEWENQRDLEREKLSIQQKKFMEKLILHRVKTIKISDGIWVPNHNYVNIEVEYLQPTEDFPDELKNLKFTEIEEVVDKIYELPHYQTFHTDESSEKKYKFIYLLDCDKNVIARLIEAGYFTTPTTIPY
jgi:hypothetical protein